MIGGPSAARDVAAAGGVSEDVCTRCRGLPGNPRQIHRLRVQSGLSRAASILQGVSRNRCVSGHGPAARKEETMKRLFVGIATAALMSGGVVAAALGAGAAQADDCAPSAMVNGICYGPNQWCPGDSLLNLTQNHVYNPVTWDMNVCHTYWHVAPDQANQGQGIYEGPNPPPLRLLRWGGQVGLLCLPRSLGLTSAYPGALRRRWLEPSSALRPQAWNAGQHNDIRPPRLQWRSCASPAGERVDDLHRGVTASRCSAAQGEWPSVERST